MRICGAVILLMAAAAHAAFEEKPLTARMAALGGTGAALAGDLAALDVNPAGLRFMEEARVSGGSARLFGLPELALQQAAFGWPTASRGAWGILARRFGSGLYQEREVALAQGVFLSSAAALGVSVRPYGARVQRYGGKSGIALGAGLLCRVHPRVDMGVSVGNAGGRGAFDSADGPAQVLRAGIAVRPTPNTLTLADLVKPGPGETSWRVGQEFRLARSLALRFGVETDPGRLSLGMGLSLGRMAVDYALRTHPVLPDEHHVSLSARWGKSVPPSSPGP